VSRLPWVRGVTDGPLVPDWRRDDEDIVIKLKGEYTQDDYKRFKKDVLKFSKGEETSNKILHKKYHLTKKESVLIHSIKRNDTKFLC